MIPTYAPREVRFPIARTASTRRFETGPRVGLLVALVITCTSSANVVSAGIVGRYSFNGNTVDTSGAGNNATAGGNYQYLTVGGRSGINTIGDGQLFYSGGGFVQLPDYGAAMNAGFSVSLWVYDQSPAPAIPQLSESYIIFGNYGAGGNPPIEFGIGPTSVDLAYVNSSGNLNLVNVGTPSVTSMRWAMLTYVYSPGSVTVYLDGSTVGSASLAMNYFPTSFATLNRHYWNAGSSSSARRNVVYDDLMVYQGALSQAEVQSLYIAQVPEPSTAASLIVGAIVMIALNRGRGGVGPLWPRRVGTLPGRLLTRRADCSREAAVTD